MKISYDAVRTFYTLPYLINNNLSPILRACCCRGLRYTTGRTFAWNGPRGCAFRDWPALYGHGVLGYGGRCVSRVGLRMLLLCAQSCSWVSFETHFLHSDSHLSEGPYIPLHRLFPSQNSPPIFLLKMKTMAGWDGGARFELGKALYRLGTCYTYLGTNSTKFCFEIE